MEDIEKLNHLGNIIKKDIEYYISNDNETKDKEFIKQLNKIKYFCILADKTKYKINLTVTKEK